MNMDIVKRKVTNRRRIRLIRCNTTVNLNFSMLTREEHEDDKTVKFASAADFDHVHATKH